MPPPETQVTDVNPHAGKVQTTIWTEGCDERYTVQANMQLQCNLHYITDTHISPNEHTRTTHPARVNLFARQVLQTWQLSNSVRVL